MQINGLFWNLGGHDRRSLVGRAAAERQVDLLVLAESGLDAEQYLAALETETGIAYECPPSLTTRLQVFSRPRGFDLSELYVDNNKRLSIRRLKWNGREYLLVVAHLISKLRWREVDQHAETQVLAQEIRRAETAEGHRRTILVGDLNMNPFEPGVVQANCLHAMMCKTDVARKTRTVQTRKYPFFYNPMWGMFGDRTPGPPGSYFQRRAEHLCYDWNIFDQILIRPEALEHFEESVEIVTGIADQHLLTARGRPDRTVGSDHLPLYFSLKSFTGP